ncbi:MAG: ABC transporter permease [Gammaproteobacteria bacterium]
MGANQGRWLRIGSMAAFLFVWQLVALWMNSSDLPTPVAVVVQLWTLATEGELLQHLAITLARVVVSFVIAMFIGSAIGMLMGRSERMDSAFDGLLVLGLNIPALVTIVLCYIWFGLTEAAAVTAVALNKIPTVAVTVREGARAVDRELLEVSTVFRLSGMRTLHSVYLPQLYPYLMAAARSGLALIWKIVLVVELLGRSSGIGYLLGTYFQFFDIGSILACTIAFASVIFCVEGLLVRPLDRRIARWR